MQHEAPHTMKFWSLHCKTETAHQQQDGESKHLISGRHGFTLKSFTWNSWSASSQSHGKWETSTLRLRKALNPGLPLPPQMLQNKRQWLSRQTPRKERALLFYFKRIASTALGEKTLRVFTGPKHEDLSEVSVFWWGGRDLSMEEDFKNTCIFSLPSGHQVCSLGERCLIGWG